MTVKVRDTQFCNALYDTSITNEPNSQRSQVILWILCLIGTLIVLVFWYWVRSRDKQKALGHIDQANCSFLYIYKFLLYIYMALVAAQTLLMTLEVMLIEIFDVPFDNFFISLMQSLILTIPHFQMALIAFLYTKNTLGAKAFNRALKIAIPYALLTFIVCLLDERNILTSVSGDKISASAVLRVVIDLLFECACMFIVCRQCQYQWKRKTVILRYLIVVMILTGFVFVAQIFESGRADGNCITQIGFYAWYILYPFIFFKTVKDDSDYHWIYASKPLIESTQQSIADLDLFSLPGYHGVHFESMEDKKFRFKKLKQMVSGYVPIIPFNKIKFDNDTIDKVENVGRGGTAPAASPPSSPRSIAATRNDRQSTSTTKLASPSRGGKRTKSGKVKDNQTIGAGSTSKVYRGVYRQHPVAVKCLTRLDKKSDMSWSDLTLIFRESILSSSLTHPNVVKFMGASLTYNGFFLVYEYCVYGDLQQIIVENSHPEEPKLSCIPQRLWYLLDIAEGMKFLHRSGFVHRDLKTANVVVNYSKKNKRFVGKICDFGVSRKLPQDQEEQMTKNSEAHDRFNRSMNRSLDAVSDQHSTHRPSFVDEASSNLTVNSNGTSVTVTTTATATPSSQGGAAATSVSALSEQQWQRFASRGNTKEITRTIHVGTPAFLAPEILLKLVRSKGVDLEKEQKKQKKREKKRLLEKAKKKKERKKRKLKEREKKRKQPQPNAAAGSVQSGVARTLNNIDEEKENDQNEQGGSEEEEEEEEVETESEEEEQQNDANHYVRGAIMDHNIDPHIYCDFATDVYSYGMILWSIVTSKLPYKGFKPMDMILMIKNAQRLNISDKEWKKWERCKEIDIDVEKLRDLLERCWAQFPYQRPTMEQIADVLKSVITESHHKSSNPPKVTLEPESMLTYNASAFVQSDTK